ncbi:MAG: glycosyl hydrolase [Pseudomonadota bacterium]
MALAALALVHAGASAQGAQRFIYSPYKHLAMWQDGSRAVTLADGRYIVDGKRRIGPGALTWAFATGECGDEKWGEVPGQQIADANVAAFDQAGVEYLVSTGGQGGVFTCASDEGMERFIKRYQSARLIGLDFDIEAGQTEAQVDSLIQRIKTAQARRPQLRYSFTVATHAGSDGRMQSLNRQGEMILAAIRRHGLQGYTMNLMVMDYGPGARRTCVLNRRGDCDMGKSALQAARNVHAKYNIPYEQIELTAMIGVNDVVSNVFTAADARLLARESRTMKLAGLHYWSLDRDTPCTKRTRGASPTCSTLALPKGEYNKLMGASHRPQ